MKRWFYRHQHLETFPAHRLIDFTKPTRNHWAKFVEGDNYNAMFVVRGKIQTRDYILVRLRSGRVGRYRVFSVLRDGTNQADYAIRATAVGYWEQPPSPPTRPIKGLLGDGTRWVRSDKGELAHLPSGFTKPASEFWKILARNEACTRRTNNHGAAGDLQSGPDL